MHRSVAKIVGILEAISASEAGTDLEEISHVVGISRSATYRALAALVERGLVVRDGEAHRYRIGPWGLRLARAYAHAESLIVVSRPHLQRLRDLTDETVCLSVVSGDQCVCVEELPSPKIIKFSQGVGAAGPLYAGASGKVLLAHLPSHVQKRILKRLRLRPIAPRTVTDKDVLLDHLEEIRRRGYATSRGERIVGAAAVAAPIWGPDRVKVTALGVFGPDTRLSAERIREVIPALLEAARAISTDLQAFAHTLPHVARQHGRAGRPVRKRAAVQLMRR